MSSIAGIPTVDSAPVARDDTRGVLRDIAHELRQPLSAIESIAYYLTLVLPHAGEKVQDHLGQLQRLVEQSNWILANGLCLSDRAPLAPEFLDFEELLSGIVLSRCWPPEHTPRLELAGNLPLVRLDRGLGRALAENLLTLFRQLATEAHPAIVRTAARDGHIVFEMETAAPGYRSETALGPGGNLSLTCARTIVAAHAGSLECTVHPATGILVRVMLP